MHRLTWTPTEDLFYPKQVILRDFVPLKIKTTDTTANRRQTKCTD